MKIAIASQNRREVTAHAGQCRRFWVIDFGAVPQPARSLVELEPGQTFHDSQAGAEHPLDGIDVLIAGGMGTGLRARLAAKGIRSIVTAETDIERVLLAFADGSLADAPAQGGDRHDHDHGSGSGHRHHGAGCGHCGCGHR